MQPQQLRGEPASSRQHVEASDVPSLTPRPTSASQAVTSSCFVHQCVVLSCSTLIELQVRLKVSLMEESSDSAGGGGS